MPFDEREFPVPPTDERAMSRRSRRLVAAWLFGVCGMLWVMITLGGATRLTGSGLSIMEWAPLSGVLPPLSQAEWQRLFDLYRQIPQAQLVNAGLDLTGFQHIFWLEWVHRLWGRLIGLAFAAPLVWLWATGRIDRRLLPRLALLFVLGGLQGAVGWFMVASGFFPDSTAVSPYRLVVHLVLALILYGAILWTGLGVLYPQRTAPSQAAPVWRLALATSVLVGLTIAAGGFVAGTHAGFTFNTFPLMDGRLVPAGYADLHPWLRNLTENVAAVQFDHRLLASLAALVAAATIAIGLRAHLPRRPRRAILVLGAAVAGQYALGVTTLVWVVPVALGTAHQALAVLVLTAALAALHALRPALMVA